MKNIRKEMIKAATKLKEYCKTEWCNSHCLFFIGKDEYGFPQCGIGDPHEWEIWEIKKGEE